MVNPMVNMSELQISLIAIGIVVVMGVILFNWLQQRRYRRHAEEAFGQKHEDVLLRAVTPAANDERIEPRLGTGTSPELQPDPDIKPDEPVEPTEPVEPAEVAQAGEPIPEPTPKPIHDSTHDSTPAAISKPIPGPAFNQFPNQLPSRFPCRPWSWKRRERLKPPERETGWTM